MYICDNPDCKLWIHEECLVNDILEKTYKRLVTDSDSQNTNGVARLNGKKSKGGPPYKGLFKATINKVPEGEPLTATVTDQRPNANPKTWTEPITCPKCSTTLTD